jgi:hypothetical protein
VLWRIHHGDIEHALRHLRHQALGYADLRAQREVRHRLPHPQHPFEQPGIPQAEFAAECQHRAVTRRHGNLLPRTFP